MSNKSDVEVYTFIIPKNYKDNDQLFGIHINLPIRRIIEAVVVVTLVCIIISLIPFIPLVDIIAKVVLSFTLGGICLVGLKGMSVTQFIFVYSKFTRNQRTLHLRKVGYIEREKRVAFEKEQQRELRRLEQEYARELKLEAKANRKK